MNRVRSAPILGSFSRQQQNMIEMEEGDGTYMSARVSRKKQQQDEEKIDLVHIGVFHP